ncbi:hypothetical protein MKQ68_14935 [Chitinophaga horti]|uniref:Uncharacterized protein n=1 Tax=Chitinophaga horti TaxID=2920382 RepID=A0ABY6IY96_9BACT|nr:hypothetical protein [Chitinophaga horti]UYQ91387.1 hypothetical protein MKQ68_14935 [Chitinophaga horti]
MPRLTATLFFILLYAGLSARQDSTHPFVADRKQHDTIYRKRFPAWYTPAKVEEINGLAIGLEAKNIKNKKYDLRDSLVVRGINVEVPPLGLAVMPFAMVRMFTGVFNRRDTGHIANIQLGKWTQKIYGINISACNMDEERQINGLNIAGMTFGTRMNGISFGTLMNASDIQNGLMIAVVNRATKSRGIQAGLFNVSGDLRGLQFGLWNKNSKRSLPFINWQFTKDKRNQ